MPTFDTPADCTPWVIGGLWPAELETVTPQTAMVAEYLKNDLQRIATSANERLRALQFAGYPEDARRAEEARIINVARAFAVLRVESTVRQLRNESTGFAAEYASLTAAPEPPPRPSFDATELIDFSAEAVAIEAEAGEPQTAPGRPEPPEGEPQDAARGSLGYWSSSSARSLDGAGRSVTGQTAAPSWSPISRSAGSPLG